MRFQALRISVSGTSRELYSDPRDSTVDGVSRQLYVSCVMRLKTYKISLHDHRDSHRRSLRTLTCLVDSCTSQSHPSIQPTRRHHPQPVRIVLAVL
jgi:hypothetical protein